MKKDFSLEERELLALEGKVLTITHDGVPTQPALCFPCPDSCGKVFSSEEAFNGICQTSCDLPVRRSMATGVEAAASFPVFSMFSSSGVLLKVDTTLDRSIGQRWWNSVSAVSVRHYATEEAQLDAVEAAIQQAHPVYDVDPMSPRGVVRPLIERAPRPEEGPGNNLVGVRLSDELDEQLALFADRYKVSKAEIVRMALRCHLVS